MSLSETVKKLKKRKPSKLIICNWKNIHTKYTSYALWIQLSIQMKKVFFSMNMIYTVKKWKILGKINYVQRTLDDESSAKH